MKGKRRNINRLTVSRSLEGSYRSFYEKCENPRHITVHTSETNNVDRIQIILFLISFSFYFKKLLVLNVLAHEGIMGTGPDNKRGRGRLAPSRVYYQGRFP